MPKHRTKYQISEDKERLINLFLDYKNYGPNTRDDVVWVVRKYLHHFESLGYAALEWVTVEQVREFILKTAAEVKTSSLHNILLYLKHFHIFLKESKIPAPDWYAELAREVCPDVPERVHPHLWRHTRAALWPVIQAKRLSRIWGKASLDLSCSIQKCGKVIPNLFVKSC